MERPPVYVVVAPREPSAEGDPSLEKDRQRDEAIAELLFTIRRHEVPLAVLLAAERLAVALGHPEESRPLTAKLRHASEAFEGLPRFPSSTRIGK